MADTHAQTLIARFGSRDATIAVVGLGHVGLPMAGAMHDAGFRVVGYDIDEAKIGALAGGRGYLRHLGDAFYERLLGSPRFAPTNDPGLLGTADAILLCVPTPLTAQRDPDLTFVRASTQLVASTLRPGQIISLESTSYPGTTREVCLPILQGARPDLRAGSDWFLAFSPEREDPGRTTHTTSTTPRLVGGVDDTSAQVAVALYEAAIDRVIRVSSAEVAEAAKLLENTYRAVNIALVNELKPTLDAMGLDLWEVIDAAATKPFGFQAFYPGPGLGGHCIPIDPFYLSWKAAQLGRRTRFIELAGEINAAMPRRTVDAVVRALNGAGKRPEHASVLVLGIAYKKNVDDVRETPAAEIIAGLLGLGASVQYHDPHAPVFPHLRKGHFPLASIELTAGALEASDVALIVTDHDTIDWDLVGRHATLIVDTRNAMASVANPKARVVKA